MKKLLIVLMAFTFMTTFAQKNKNEKREDARELRGQRTDLSPEQRAELATKKLALHLDLTEAQQKKIHKLELEQALKRKEHLERRDEQKKLTDNQRFEMRSNRLDEQLAHKKEMKSILTEAQFAKWEKVRQSKRKGMKSQ